MNQRQQQALRTKNKILKVALELFSEKGFSNVTVDEIIKESSSSKGAFYNHFKSKHDLFLEKFKELDHYYVEILYPEINKLDSNIEKLKSFLSAQMSHIENELGWDITRTIYEHELNTEHESFFLLPDRPLYRILYEICEDGQAKNEFRDDYSTEELFKLIIRTMRGILYDWSMNNGSYSLTIEQEPLFDIVITGLKK